MYKIIKFDIHKDERGELVSIENSRNIPFDIKRVFYIFNVKQNARRAQHANMKVQELILCLNGSCELLLDNGKGQRVNIALCDKSEAVYVNPGIWIELSDFSQECLVLVMSDHYYNRNNLICDYQEFTEAVK